MTLEERIAYLEDDVHNLTKDLLDVIVYLREKETKSVNEDTQLYETCLRFLEAAVERKDEERARYWSRIAFQYAPIPTKNYLTNMGKAIYG